MLLVKDLISAKQGKNEDIVNNINDGLIDLRKDINRKETLENKNLKTLADFVWKILDFNQQRQVKESKLLTPKQMNQRLPIALTQVKTGNASENLLNEIRLTIIYFSWQKEDTKKVYNNIMNSIKL